MDTPTRIITAAEFRRFQELALYFFGASFAAHYLEFVWISLRYHDVHMLSVVESFSLIPLPLAEPYGFGAVATIFFVIPLVKKYKINPVVTFIVAAVLMAAVEYVCAAVLTLVFGHNYYWDYSNHPFNLRGYICLETSLLFGMLATIFIYYVYPWAEQSLQRMTSRNIRIVFTILAVLYALHFLRLAVLAG